MHQILCESPFTSRDFYAIRTLILWRILGAYFLLIWGGGVVKIVFRCFHPQPKHSKSRDRNRMNHLRKAPCTALLSRNSHCDSNGNLHRVGAPKGGCFDQGLLSKVHLVVFVVPRNIGIYSSEKPRIRSGCPSRSTFSQAPRKLLLVEFGREEYGYRTSWRGGLTVLQEPTLITVLLGLPNSITVGCTRITRTLKWFWNYFPFWLHLHLHLQLFWELISRV